MQVQHELFIVVELWFTLLKILCNLALRQDLGDTVHIYSYADEFLAIVRDQNPEVLLFKYNVELEKLPVWSNSMKFQFSSAKAQIIFVPWYGYHRVIMATRGLLLLVSTGRSFNSNIKIIRQSVRVRWNTVCLKTFNY